MQTTQLTMGCIGIGAIWFECTFGMWAHKVWSKRCDWISGRIEGDFSEFSLTNDNGGGAFSRLSRLVVDGVESRLES